VTWDDHEVDNDYAGAYSETNDPPETFLARRAAAFQAYYEHMPLRPDSMPNGPDARLYQRLTFGDLAELNVLDTRLRFLLATNRHFSFYDYDHGYTRCEITPDFWRSDYRALASVETPDEPIATIASFVVENGKPGAVSG